MRLIDADALIQKVKEEEEERHLDKGDASSLQFLIDEYAEQVDAVPVIRCKDCKYYDGKWCKLHAISYFDLNDVMKSADDFCSYAERKEE